MYGITKLIREFPPTALETTSHHNVVKSNLFDNIVCSYCNNRIHIYDNNHCKKRQLDIMSVYSDEQITCVSFAGDRDQYLTVGLQNGTILVLSILQSKVIAKYSHQKENQSILKIESIPHSFFILSFSEKEIQIWDIQHHESLLYFDTLNNSVKQAWIMNQETVLVLWSDHTLSVVVHSVQKKISFAFTILQMISISPMGWIAQVAKQHLMRICYNKDKEELEIVAEYKCSSPISLWNAVTVTTNETASSPEVVVLVATTTTQLWKWNGTQSKAESISIDENIQRILKQTTQMIQANDEDLILKTDTGNVIQLQIK